MFRLRRWAAADLVRVLAGGGLTIRSSRHRFVPAKQWQKELATVLPPLRGGLNSGVRPQNMMHRTRTVLLLAIVATLILVSAFSVYGLLNPPYTDEQIQASLVDTWEAAARTTTALLFLVALAVVLSLVLAYRGAGSTRRLSAIAVFLAVLAGALVCSSHIVLTNRVAQLTGQALGRLW